MICLCMVEAVILQASKLLLLYKQLINTSRDEEVTTDQLLSHIVHARWCHDLFSILQSAHPHQHLGTLLTILPHLPLSTINSDVHVN